MLRVPTGNLKENKPVVMGGCNCKRQKIKNTFNTFEMLPSKVLVDNFRPSLRDITSEKNICNCKCTGARSKSTSDDGEAASNKKRSDSTSTVYDGKRQNIIIQNVIIKGPVETVNTYQHVIKKDKNKPKDKQSKSTETAARSPANLNKKPHAEKPSKPTGTQSSTKPNFINANKKDAPTSTSSVVDNIRVDKPTVITANLNKKLVENVQEPSKPTGTQSSTKPNLNNANKKCAPTDKIRVDKPTVSTANLNKKLIAKVEKPSKSIGIHSSTKLILNKASAKSTSTSTSSMVDKIHVDKTPKTVTITNSTMFNFASATYSKTPKTITAENSPKFATFSTSTKFACTGIEVTENKHSIPVEIITRSSGSSRIKSELGSSQGDVKVVTKFKKELPSMEDSTIKITLPQIKMEMYSGFDDTWSKLLEEETLINHSNQEKRKSFPLPLKRNSGLDLMNASSLSTWSDISQISLFSDPGSKSSVTSNIGAQKHTPILPNRYTSENIFISKKPDRVREPKVKRRSTSINESRHCFSLPYVGDIYNEEYLHDIFTYVCDTEKTTVLKNGFLEAHNQNYKCRSGIANWLFKVQACLQFSEGEHYLAVYLLDRILSQTYVPINMYQLLIMTTLWIATKVMGSHNIKASTLIHYSDGAYLIQQLLKMELKVLKLMNFHIPTVEPSLCIHYYLKLLQLEKSDLAKLTAFFILDCFSLLPEFSSTPPSILAAAAINFTIKTYDGEAQENVHRALRRTFPEKNLKQIKSVEAQLHLHLTNMSHANYLFDEPYKKYGGQTNTSKLTDILKV